MNQRTLVTHALDAERYIACGWELTWSKVVTLKGLNKKYMECTVVWKNPEEQILPKDAYPEIAYYDANVPDVAIPMPRTR